MREIKFKYSWQHGETGRIVNKVFRIEEIERGKLQEYWRCIGFDKYTIFARAQFTGVRDKKKIEVYEHDNIEGTIEGNLPISGTVVYAEEYGGFAVKNDAGITMLHRLCSIKVVGFNSELLKESSK